MAPVAGGGASAAAPSPPSPLSTFAVAKLLCPLYLTHINQGILVTMPFVVAVYMVRDWEAEASGGAAVSEQTVGKATGLLAATFCAAQLLTSFAWGIVSDRIGRKPVLVVGNISCVASAVWFGLAGSYWEAVAARALGGALNAIILVEKAMIGEGLPSRADQATAFGLMSLCWGLGSLAGPVIGSLSSPCGAAAGQGSGLLCGEHGLLAARPYFLPCLVAGLLSAVATVLTITHLEETLPSRRAHAGGSGGSSGARYAPVPASEDTAAAAGMAGSAAQGGEVELQASMKHRRPDSGLGSLADSSNKRGSTSGKPGGKLRAFRGDSARLSATGSGRVAEPAHDKQHVVAQGASSSDSEDEFVVFSAADLEAAVEAHPPGGKPPEVPWYRQRACITTLVGYGLIAFLFNVMEEVLPIFASAGVAQGGLGLTPAQLAPSLSFGGIVLCAFALKGFPWLMRRVGVVRALRLGLYMAAPMALSIPACSLFGGTPVPTQVSLFLTSGFKAVAGTTAFTACLILVNMAAPKHALGSVNGCGQSVASLVRGLGPALGGLMWGWSLSLAPAWLPHQYIPFGLMGLLALATDFVYRGLEMPEDDELRSSGDDGGSGDGDGAAGMPAGK